MAATASRWIRRVRNDPAQPATDHEDQGEERAQAETQVSPPRGSLGRLHAISIELGRPAVEGLASSGRVDPRLGDGSGPFATGRPPWARCSLGSPLFAIPLAYRTLNVRGYQNRPLPPSSQKTVAANPESALVIQKANSVRNSNALVAYKFTSYILMAYIAFIFAIFLIVRRSGRRRGTFEVA